jgi:elongation of very long chain fatty acids protein 4
MKLYPEGDAYFGALLNSWIHVMMYGYYALTLMGVKCPWKRYLTQAQLLQFASVVVYTAFSLYFNYIQGQLEGRHVLACAIQVGEMVSLFILFSSFYRRSYKNKKLKAAKDEDKVEEMKDECNAAIAESVNANMYVDECHAAVKSLVAPVTGAANLGPGKTLEMTAKSTKKEIESARRTGKGVSRPSWSFLG